MSPYPSHRTSPYTIGPHDPPIEIGDQLTDRLIEFNQAEEAAVAKARQHPSLGNLDRNFDFCLIAGLVRPGWQDCGAIVPGHILVRTVEAGIIAVGVGHSRLEIVADRDGRHSAEGGEHADMAADPVAQPFARPSLAVNIAGGSQCADEQLHSLSFARYRVDDIDGVAGVVDKHLLTGGVALAHRWRHALLPIVRSLNPDAELIETDFARVPLDKVLNTGRFDFEKAEQHPLWFKELNGFKDHVPETEEYGIRSFVYRERRPLDPMKLKAFINKSWPGIVRAKGFFWLATRPHYVGEISQAGALIRTGKRGLWWASVPKNQWPDHPEWKAAMKPYLDPIWGDRRQEIVFIGCDPMDERQIRSDLDACLVKEKNFIPGHWRDLPDPFPSWERQAA